MFKLNKNQIRHLNEVADELVNEFKVAGWKRFKSTYRNIDAFYNKELGLVIKCPAMILEPRTPLSVRVPTVSLGDGWVAQPLVVKTRLKAAKEALRGKLKPLLKAGFCPDLHVGNVGWYEGKPVMFDW